jgi:hypothetical protein
VTWESEPSSISVGSTKGLRVSWVIKFLQASRWFWYGRHGRRPNLPQEASLNIAAWGSLITH